MGKTLEKKLSKLPAARLAKIEKRTTALIAEEQSLRDLRRARALTQKSIAKKLGIGQDGVSKLEGRSDMMLSTLRDYVEAMGGQLNLIAKFPDRPQVSLSGIGAVEAGALAQASRSKRKPRHKGQD